MHFVKVGRKHYIMNNRIRMTFLLLVIAQAIHAVEEYLGNLWEVYAPAKFVCNLISPNPKTGFLIINTLFTSFSFLYWWSLVQRKPMSSSGLIWLWIVLEILNVIGHISWTLYAKTYTPGGVTAIILLILVISLFKQLISTNSALAKDNKK